MLKIGEIMDYVEYAKLTEILGLERPPQKPQLQREDAHRDGG